MNTPKPEFVTGMTVEPPSNSTIPNTADWREAYGKFIPVPTQHACPNCGYCPHCGRGGWHTYPRPWYPQPGYLPGYVSPYPWYNTPYPEWPNPVITC